MNLGNIISNLFPNIGFWGGDGLLSIPDYYIWDEFWIYITIVMVVVLVIIGIIFVYMLFTAFRPKNQVKKELDNSDQIERVQYEAKTASARETEPFTQETR